MIKQSILMKMQHKKQVKAGTGCLIEKKKTVNYD